MTNAKVISRDNTIGKYREYVSPNIASFKGESDSQPRLKIDGLRFYFFGKCPKSLFKGLCIKSLKP